MPTFSPKEYQGPDSEKVWNELIKDDLETARALIKSHPRNSIILSAAAVEKSIKKYMFLHDKLDENSSSHNTKILAEQAGLYNIAPIQVQDIFKLLSGVHVPFSYPITYTNFISANRTKAASDVYNLSKKAINWIEGVINGEDNSAASGND